MCHVETQDATLLVVPQTYVAPLVEVPLLPTLWRAVMDQPKDLPPPIDWADVVRNLAHLVHELVLADLRRLEDVRKEMVKAGFDVPHVIEPEEDMASQSPTRGVPGRPGTRSIQPAGAEISDERWNELVRHFGGHRVEP